MTPLENLLKATDEGLSLLYRQHRELLIEIEQFQHQRRTILRLIERAAYETDGPEASASLDEDLEGLSGPVQAGDGGPSVPLEPLRP